MFYNLNANDPTKWTYQADESRPGINYGQWKGVQGRVAWQAAAKQKIGLTWDDQQFCRCPDSISAVTASEAGNDRNFPVERTVQADWTSPVSSRLLLEASAVHKFDRWGFNHLQKRDVINPAMISATEQGGAIPGLTYRSAAQYTDPDLMSGWGKRENNWEFSAGVQRELMPRTSLDVSYFRRWYGNLLVLPPGVAVPDPDQGTWQMDLRFAKLVRFSGRTVAFNVDLYNAFNANPVVLLNNNFAAWQVPQGILQSRFVKLSAQLDF